MALLIRLRETVINVDHVDSFWVKPDGIVVMTVRGQAWDVDGEAGDLLRWWLEESGVVVDVGDQRRAAVAARERQQAMIAAAEELDLPCF